MRSTRAVAMVQKSLYFQTVSCVMLLRRQAFAAPQNTEHCCMTWRSKATPADPWAPLWHGVRKLT